MSKQSEACEERIPSYEESIATSSDSNSPRSPPNSVTTTNKVSAQPARQSIQQRTRTERIRRLTNLVNNHIDPAVSASLENGISRFILLLLPTNALPTANTSTLTHSAITSPTLSLPTTLIPLQANEKLNESQDDYPTPFLLQGIVFSDLAALVYVSLTPSSTPHIPPPEQPISSPLPNRPESRTRSWLSRRFGLPPAEHDPTGETGKWNLGWRAGEEDPMSSGAEMDTEELRIMVKAHDVSFRVESEMGLLESLNARCIWIELELR